MGAFTRHLRDNGFRVCMPETEMALRSMPLVDVGDPRELRMALKAICAADAEGYSKFDDLFDAYWHNPGRSRTKHKPVSNLNQDQGAFSNLSKFLSQHDTGESGDTDTPDNDNHGGDFRHFFDANLGLFYAMISCIFCRGKCRLGVDKVNLRRLGVDHNPICRLGVDA